MPHSFGYRARTRDMFSRPFREQGPTKLSTYLIKYKVGDYVDIKCNPSIHKGMPFKNYHGRTGVIFNVTKRAVGVRVNKEVRARHRWWRGGASARRRCVLRQTATAMERDFVCWWRWLRARVSRGSASDAGRHCEHPEGYRGLPSSVRRSRVATASVPRGAVAASWINRSSL